MGLDAVANFDPVTLFTTGNYDSNGGGSIVSTPGALHYYDRLDFFSADWSAGTGAGEWVRWDPLLLSNTGAIFDDTAQPSDISPAGNSRRVCVGEWDRGLNVQKVYQFAESTSTNVQFNELNPLSLNAILTADPFTKLGQVAHRGSLISTDIGFYDQAGTSGWVFFETWGFAFNPKMRIRHTDNIQYTGVPGLVSLATGAATIVQGLTVAFGTQTNQFSDPQLFGQNVEFLSVQFVPDDSSTPAAPKGQLFLFSAGSNNPANSTFSRFWVQVVDWNPLAASGTPSRTHLRRRLLSAVDFLKATPASLNGIHETGAPINKFLFFHPRTNRLFFYTCATGAPGGQLDAAESKFITVSVSPAVSSLSDPSAQTTVKTGSTITFLTEALGSLNEQIGGVDVAFTLQRVSSVDELLTIVPATPGQTVSVAHGPISPTDPNVSPVIVKKNGTPLVETTNYTLNRAAGQITFVGPEPVDGNVYTATYRHYATPASPPHGTLLNASAVTDLDGAAACRIKYAEENPVADRWDRLDAVEA